MKKNSTIKLIILFIAIFFFSHNALAASLDLNVGKNILQTGEDFTLTVSLNTEGDSINTLAGDLNYDNNFIQAEAINLGASFISFWVEKPELKTPGTIHFSGITPGGIFSSGGEVFKVIFKTKNAGDTVLALNNANLFLNDGKGTIIPAKIINTNIKITELNNDTTTPIETKDTISPEKFVTIRTKYPSMYDGKWFIVFSTTDKESGVDYFKVCEFFN